METGLFILGIGVVIPMLLSASGQTMEEDHPFFPLLVLGGAACAFAGFVIRLAARTAAREAAREAARSGEAELPPAPEGLTLYTKDGKPVYLTTEGETLLGSSKTL